MADKNKQDTKKDQHATANQQTIKNLQKDIKEAKDKQKGK